MYCSSYFQIKVINKYVIWINYINLNNTKRRTFEFYDRYCYLFQKIDSMFKVNATSGSLNMKSISSVNSELFLSIPRIGNKNISKLTLNSNLNNTAVVLLWKFSTTLARIIIRWHDFRRSPKLSYTWNSCSQGLDEQYAATRCFWLKSSDQKDILIHGCHVIIKLLKVGW